MVLSTASCVQPSYEAANTDADSWSASLDAATRDVVSLDAAVPLDDELPKTPEAGVREVDAPSAVTTDPAIEEFPLGQYALVARLYGKAVAAVGGWYGEQIVALLDVQRRAGRLEGRWKTCDYGGRFVLGVVPDTVYGVLNPERLPERTLELNVDGHGFYMLGGPVFAGYEETQDCPAGGVQVHADRPWLPDGRCTCTNDPSPPTTPTDCRVIDSDGDGAPGFSMKSTGGFDNIAYMRMHDGSQVLGGRIAADGRHTAQFAASFETYRLACDHEPCMTSGGQICPLVRNPVRFMQLSPTSIPWTCSDVMNAVVNSNYIGLGPIAKPDC